MSQLLFWLQKGTATSGERALWETLEKKLGKAAASELFSSPQECQKVEQRLWQAIRPRKRMWNFRPWVAAAAVSLLVGLGAYSWWNSIPQSNSHHLVVNTSNNPLEHRLADGSLVFLNQGAQLRYTQDFGSTHRKLALVGESFFEVESNPDLPFEVHTQELTTRVTGTQFNIQQGPEQIRVTVTEGSVVVASETQKFKLRPNMQGVYDRSQAQLNPKNVQAELFQLWRQKTVRLDNIRLESLAQVFQSLYGQQLVFADPQLKNKRLSIEFSPQQPLATLLDRINYIQEFRLEHQSPHQILVQP